MIIKCNIKNCKSYDKRIENNCNEVIDVGNCRIWYDEEIKKPIYAFVETVIVCARCSEKTILTPTAKQLQGWEVMCGRPVCPICAVKAREGK